MIFSLFRFLILGGLGMSLGYVLVRYYLSSLLRERLENDWDEIPSSAQTAEKHDWVETRMATQHSGIRRRAFLISFGIPVVSVIVIYTVVNFL